MALITLDDGVKITTFRPSAWFNPLTVSPEDVVKNGFPTRSEDLITSNAISAFSAN